MSEVVWSVVGLVAIDVLLMGISIWWILNYDRLYPN